MNRTIKFRGKRIDNGQWVYGFLAEDYYINDVNSEDFPSIEIASETVGQFTGLLDRNGKEIYEGDILHERVARCIVDKRIVKFCYGSFIAESTYNQGAQCYGEPHEKFQSLKYFAVNDIKIEVIGNIHDNPELLS